MATRAGTYRDDDLGGSVNGDTGIMFEHVGGEPAGAEIAPPEPPLQCINFIYIVLVAMGGALFGFEISNISNAHTLMCNGDFKSTCGPGAKDEAFWTGLVTSCITIGAFIGTATAGFAQDYFGRKITVVIASVIYILGVVVEFVAPNYGILVTGRIVVGVGVGWFASTVPMYIAELSPSSIRGRLVTSNQLNICIGILLGYIVSWAFAQGDNQTGHEWRYILGMGAIPAALLFLGFLFVTPRSPRWLAKQRRFDEAREVLLRLRGDHPEFVEWELKGISDTTTKSSSGWAKLTEPHVIRTVLVGISISVIQQIVGVNSVNGYAPTILEAAGFSAKNSLTMSIMIGVVKVGFVAVALALMDCLGRKTLLIGGTVIMGASMIVLGVLLDKYTSDPPPGAVWGSASMLFLAMASFELGQGPVVWLLLSEMFPLNVRGVAMSLGSSSNFIFNFLVMLTFPLLKAPDALGEGGVFYLYAGICFVSCVFIAVFVPETRGKTLEEIEQVFMGAARPESKTKLLAKGEL